jgi:formate dehydrogenase iron-sulfur subunit
MSALTQPQTGGYGVLVDLDKCIGCRACEVACQDWNGRRAVKTEFSPTFTNPPDLTANTWKVVFFYEGQAQKQIGSLSLSQISIAPVPYQCMHCLDPPCARACPVGAISVTKEGAVVIDKDLCIGCGYCQAACPYNVPRQGSDGKFYKCTLCVDRIQAGKAPACVEVCPTGVFTFGPIEQITSAARQEAAKGRTVYGLDLTDYIGRGTRWIYVASPDRQFAISQRFPASPYVPWESLKEFLKTATEFLAAPAAVALAALGLAAWRKERSKEKQEAHK